MGDNGIAKGVFDGWQLSGISTFLSGRVGHGAQHGDGRDA